MKYPVFTIITLDSDGSEIVFTMYSEGDERD